MFFSLFSHSKYILAKLLQKSHCKTGLLLEYKCEHTYQLVNEFSLPHLIPWEVGMFVPAFLQSKSTSPEAWGYACTSKFAPNLLQLMLVPCISAHGWSKDYLLLTEGLSLGFVFINQTLMKMNSLWKIDMSTCFYFSSTLIFRWLKRIWKFLL